ncbi:MAG: M28 family peptidase [Bacteroidales bacterium]|nr:M28 family peptidase [Bacteroidales bacterium]
MKNKFAYRFCLPLLIVLFCHTGINAQDTNYVRQVLRELSSQKMYGRGYSFRGDSIAAEYIRGQLKMLHVEPLVKDYFQHYTFSTFSMEGPVKLRVNGLRLEPFTQFRIPAWSMSSWGEYKVVTVSGDVLMDAEQLRLFLKKNKGKLDDMFVYVDASAYHASDDAEQKRFIGHIGSLRQRNPFNSRGIIVGMNELNTYSPAYTNYEHGYAYIEVLSSVMPQKVKKIDCSFFTQFHPDYQTQNVYGVVNGEVDTMVVYTAHYDHLGTMGDSVVFYGAHDNASGVSALLDLARMAVYEKPHYTHLFCFFSGEEAGLMGSKYAAEHPVFDFSKVRLLINIDMFCGGNEGIMVFNANAPETDPFVKRLENLNNALGIAPEIRRRDNRANSDHWWFSKQMPALFILSMGQRYGGYHDPADSCSACGLENYLNYITLISSLAL